MSAIKLDHKLKWLLYVGIWKRPDKANCLLQQMKAEFHREGGQYLGIGLIRQGGYGGSAVSSSNTEEHLSEDTHGKNNK